VEQPLRYTYDGVPVAPDEPYGAAIPVRRTAAADGQHEYLVLHRAHNGPDYAGDWAWTPPSGSRQPGEPVLAAALRELAEETGLAVSAADLRALDLSGEWVRFGLDVPPDTQVRVDAEHDRFEWLPVAEAIARCQPEVVSDGLRLAEACLSAAITFRPLTTADLPTLVSWRQAPHAATAVHAVAADGKDCGFARHYRVGDYPDYAAATGRPDAIGIDYAIAVADMTGRGLGAQLIWSYLRDVARPAHPAARQALASPDTANRRSIRALEKAGFCQLGPITVPGEAAPEQLCVLDLAKFFGSRSPSR
jgi:8-oxo-dGTP pyrophosphatase MutT (NUDIX family)